MHSWLMIRGLSQQVLLSAVLLVLASNASAQWVQTSGPKEGTARTLLAVPNASGGTNLFAGQLYIWRTSDNGASCSQSVQVTSLGQNQPPKVERQSQGDCSAVNTRKPTPAVQQARPEAPRVTPASLQKPQEPAAKGPII